MIQSLIDLASTRGSVAKIDNQARDSHDHHTPVELIQQVTMALIRLIYQQTTYQAELRQAAAMG